MEKAPGILVKEDEEQRQKTNEIVTPPLSRKRKLSGEEGEKKASMELPSLTEEPNIPFPIELQEGASTQIYSSGNLCEGCLGGGHWEEGCPQRAPLTQSLLLVEVEMNLLVGPTWLMKLKVKYGQTSVL